METVRRIVFVHPMQLLLPLAIFGATFGVGWVCRRLVMRALDAWTTRSSSRAGLILRQALHGPMLIWAAILGVHLGLQSSELPERVTAWGSKTLLVLWVLSLTIMCMLPDAVTMKARKKVFLLQTCGGRFWVKTSMWRQCSPGAQAGIIKKLFLPVRSMHFPPGKILCGMMWRSPGFLHHMQDTLYCFV